MALRTQQILAEETTSQRDRPARRQLLRRGADDRLRKAHLRHPEEVEERANNQAYRAGWFQKHIADFAYETALRKQSGESR